MRIRRAKTVAEHPSEVFCESERRRAGIDRSLTIGLEKGRSVGIGFIEPSAKEQTSFSEQILLNELERDLLCDLPGIHDEISVR